MKNNNFETLNNQMTRRSNNLSFLKFLGAILVILAHSFLLSKGKDSLDFFATITNGRVGLGMFGVCIFFVASGFFISKSAENKNIRDFMKARIIRIFPALLLVVLISIFILGSILTSYNIVDYFLNVDTYKYLLNALLIPIHSLPGVFNENIYSNVVNGSLWTLPVEFFCYIALLIFAKINFLNKKVMLVLSPIILLLLLLTYSSNIPIFLFVRPYAHPLFVFFIGMFYYVFRDRIILNQKSFLISLLLFLGVFLFGAFEIAVILFFSHMIMFVSFGMKQCSDKIANLGKYSYGIYLVGFPVQQTLVSVFGGQMPILLNFLFSSIISIILSVLIYHLVDERISHFRRG